MKKRWYCLTYIFSNAKFEIESSWLLFIVIIYCIFKKLNLIFQLKYLCTSFFHRSKLEINFWLIHSNFYVKSWYMRKTMFFTAELVWLVSYWNLQRLCIKFINKTIILIMDHLNWNVFSVILVTFIYNILHLIIWNF